MALRNLPDGKVRSRLLCVYRPVAKHEGAGSTGDVLDLAETREMKLE